MALNPPIFPKQQGNPILSSDWNAGFGEVDRLDHAKVDIANGHTTGLLTSQQIAVGGLVVQNTISAPAGSVSLAMLGMTAVPLEPLVLPGGMAARLVYERYPAGSPPPRLPASVRITSISPPAPILLHGEWVTELSGAAPGETLIERYTYLSQTQQIAVTVQAVVLSSTPLAAFQPFWGLDVGSAPAIGPDGAIAYNNRNGNLALVAAKGGGELAVAMQAGTSPSVAWLPPGGGQTSGSYYVFANTATHILTVAVGGQPPNTTALTLAPGTNPAVIARSGSISYAWCDGDGKLVIASGVAGPAVITGGSPSIAVWKGGARAVAYQGSDGFVYVADSRVTGGPTKVSPANSPATVAPGSNPCIASDDLGNYIVAWHDQSGLSLVWSANFTPTGHAMADATSPSAAVLRAGGYVLAFQGANNHLWILGSGGETADTGVAMRVKTSPSIAALAGGGYEVAVQGANGNLWTYGDESGGPIDTGLAMADGTSPSIAR